MRIVLLSPYTEPIKGGISSYARELIDAYRGMENETSGYSVQGLTNSRFVVLGPSRAGFLFRSFLELVSVKPDLIHAQSHWYVLFPAYVLHKLRPHTRLLFTFHTMPMSTGAGPGYQMLRAMLRSCDAVTFVSAQLMKAIKLASSVRQVVVYPAPEQAASRLPSGSNRPNNPRVVFAGPLTWPGKVMGVSWLLKAFAAISATYAQWRLVIVGDGPFRPRLEREAADLGLVDRVSFLGFIDGVLDEIAGADVYAQVSLQEGLPLSLLNAMALGKAILATDVGGMPEVVTDRLTGLLVSPSSDAIASGLAELLGNEMLRRRLGQTAREWISTELTWEKVATRHLELVGDH